MAALILQFGTEVSAVGQAAAALAALQTVPVQLGVLQEAALLLDELGFGGADARRPRDSPPTSPS
ncbi:hypothetical protein [Streptomyces sp. NBC_00063]|uniref:hypothetical protein n=1 Tax=Streptomyces sp. NBC_00063 TaxID=2975638 RepID=UPI002259FC97|nr:hypothetical protein [Streptomyces sp. NBC_00063]MCX5443891.1 hypothetical protein [Streptomyces sp. NBC_00063]